MVAVEGGAEYAVARRVPRAAALRARKRRVRELIAASVAPRTGARLARARGRVPLALAIQNVRAERASSPPNLGVAICSRDRRAPIRAREARDGRLSQPRADPGGPAECAVGETHAGVRAGRAAGCIVLAVPNELTWKTTSPAPRGAARTRGGPVDLCSSVAHG